ncbi:MAG: AmmeMemoRadiSam system protein B [Bryobacteraceae bacterium]|jgi:AmmeMemoRadiSam system protein B/AmmeMemoRadiSam system protein A
MPAAGVHVSPFSGSWYPAAASELRSLLGRLFAESERRTGRCVTPRTSGFVVPHAGLVYSGTVAAAAYRHLRVEEPKRVVVLGFSHHGAAPGAWIPDVSALGTPLGEVAVDCAFSAALAEGGEFGTKSEDVLCDHSVEIQLPLLQFSAPAASVVPVYVSRMTHESRAAAARKLSSLLGPETVVIASSDFTHYGRGFSYQPFPADENAGERLRDIDEGAIDAAGTLCADQFLAELRATGSTVCGFEPISLLLETLRLAGREEEIFQTTLDYQTSGEITGDYTHSVSYAALGYFPYRALELGPEDQRLLVASARATLVHYLETGERRPIPPQGGSPALERHAAAFVTLTSQGDLRGCVGRKASTEPLATLVPSLTLAAALEDTRFAPIRRGEADLELEVSVLTPMKRIASLDEFRVNEHGALLEAGFNHGLLLPQVATERNWTARQFLDALARKAGAGRDAYRDPSARVYVFRAQIIR